MSTKYSGGIITKSPVTPAGPYETGAAPGVWTVEQALQYTKQGIWPTAGNVPNYIEDVFSTWLYTGTGNGSGTPGTVATITNGINLSGQGGLVWLKNRGRAVDHGLYDTVRGALNGLQSNGTSGQSAYTNTLTAFTSSGFSLGNDGSNTVNLSGDTYVSWTFREQAKFFDIVTYTGTGSATTIAHNLGSVPGCIIVKATSTTSSWATYHQSLGASSKLNLDTTNASSGFGGWNNTSPTSTVFSLGTDGFGSNDTGVSYVAYLFAHNAGGFGLTGTDNVISCGSFTTDGAGDATVNLGYEPQWLLTRNTASGWNWNLLDTMRGWSNRPPANPSGDNLLFANLINQENTASAMGNPTATGFTFSEGGSSTYIYIAIRRGPMKVPTVGTSVFSPVAQTKTGFPSTVTAGFPVDLTIEANRASDGLNSTAIDRLRGGSVASITSGTASEYGSAGCSFASNTVFSDGWLNNTSNIYWMFKRAPSFFDEVCYTGTGVATNYSHNLNITPQLIILKNRSSAVNWYVMYSGTSYMILNNTNGGANGSGSFDLSLATSSTFYLGADGGSGYNGSGQTYVAYLFATCAGVSKVGSYTGTGATQTINCGFGAGGSRFVLVKRTDTTGDWYVWDSARGMVSGTDPSLLLNSTAAEVNANSIYTISTGFQIVSTAAGINASGGTYIFLSIA
jgi:hypothetical protein